jgi:sugar phosphate isomerase/epimerase
VKLGFLVPKDMRGLPYSEIVEWAVQNHFSAVDAPIEDAETVLKAGLEVSATSLRFDLFSSNSDTRAQAQRQALDVIDRAASLGLRRAMIIHPYDLSATPESNLELFKSVYTPLCERAERSGFQLCMENWPNNGMNFAYTPELIAKLFEAVPSRTLGLCMDPSHMVWLGIDYIRATREFADRIHYAHAKDTEILADELYRYGIFGRVFGRERPARPGWWRYRLPGYGQVNWASFISTLIELGYDDILAIEHEDEIWYGSVERNKSGLLRAKQYLSQFIV